MSKQQATTTSPPVAFTLEQRARVIARRGLRLALLAQQRAVAIDNTSGPGDALEFIETQMDYELSAIDGNVRRIYEAMQAPIPAQAEE
jgi:hypothetical protein